MRNYRDKHGTKAWVGLTAYVLTYDLWSLRGGHETLSGAFWRAMENPRKRWVVVIAWVLVTKHLVLPKFMSKKDPLNIVAGLVDRIRV